MKNIKILICAILFILSSNIAKAKHTQITKENGGANGYKHVTEIRNETSDILNCKEPGYSSCTFTKDNGHGLTIIGNGTDYLVEYLVAYAEEQMNQGVASGITVFPGQVLVTWETTEYGYIITILNGDDFPEHLK